MHFSEMKLAKKDYFLKISRVSSRFQNNSRKLYKVKLCQENLWIFKRYNFKDALDPDGQNSNALEEKTRRKRSSQDDTGIMHK